MWEYLCTDYLYLCTDCLCHIFPQVYWKISPWYLVELEMEGLEMAPGVKEDLLSAQWL